MKRLKIFIATAGPFGYIRPASGTYGTMAAMPLAAVMTFLHPAWQAALLVILYFIFVWAADEAEIHFDKKDPREIVCDEVIGFMVAMFALPADSVHLVVAFFIFRFFDIAKPPPIRAIDRNMPGGWGVVTDDVLAGVYTNLVLRLIL